MHKLPYLAIFLVLIISSCNLLPKQEQPVEKPVVAIATINGTVISFDEYKKLYLAQRLDLTDAEAGQIATARRTQKEAILNDQIDQLLLLQAAEKHHITVKDEELENLYKSLTSNWDATEFEKELAARGQTVEAFRESLKKNLLISRYLSQQVYARVDISEEELLANFQQNPALYIQEEAVKLRQIMVPSEDMATEVAEAMKKGGRFEDLAQEYSTATEANQGGMLGWIKRGSLPEELEEVIFNLKKGKVSEVVKSEYGYHIFLVEEHLAQKELKFEQVKAAIQQNVRAQKEQEAQATVIHELRDAATININTDLFDLLD